MQQRDSKFRVMAHNRIPAMLAIKDLASRTAEGGGMKGGERFFSWVDTDEFLNAKTLEDAMWAWRWQIESDDLGDIYCIMFEGEKIGNDDILFGAIAPFVEAGSFIEMQGEDGAMWRWSFDGKTMTEQNAKVTWE